MSLNNVDKGSDDRAMPEPNAPDVRTNRMALNTTSIAPRADGTQLGARVVVKDDTITVFDAANTRIIIGRLPDGTYGIAVSNPGFNVSDIYSA